MVDVSLGHPKSHHYPFRLELAALNVQPCLSCVKKLMLDNLDAEV